MKKVLVIDDDVDFLAAMERLLRNFKLQLVPATSSDNIKSIVERLKPVMIILDVFIGDEDGRNVYKEIQPLQTLMGIPVILCSGLPLTQKELDEMPGTTFIAKPFSVATIEELLQRLQVTPA
jgi:DNA-binding NtrC family response regulator